MSGSNTRIIATRYARSLFELALEKHALEAVEKDLLAVRQMLAQDAALRGFLTNPIIARSEKAKAMQALAQKMGACELTQKFFGRLGLNQRLSALAPAIEDFLARLSHHRGELPAEIISAQPLSAAQVKEVESALTQSLGKRVVATTRVNSELLGGLQVSINGKLLDYSLQGKLSRLAAHLKSKAA